MFNINIDGEFYKGLTRSKIRDRATHIIAQKTKKLKSGHEEEEEMEYNMSAMPADMTHGAGALVTLNGVSFNLYEIHGIFETTSFADLEEKIEFNTRVREVFDLHRLYELMYENILYLYGKSLEEKISMIESLTQEYLERIGMLSFVEKNYSKDQSRLAKRTGGLLPILRAALESGETNKENYLVYKEVDNEGKELPGGRWVGWVTNKWIDREDEILTDAAHKEFVAYLDANPKQAPEHWKWHIPQTKSTYPTDWWDYFSGFFVYSGKLTEAEYQLHKSAKAKNPEPSGMSHGFYVLEREGNLITKYRTFEVSELPLSVAANPYTSFSSIKKELTEDLDNMNADKKAWLESRLGEDVVSSILESTEKSAEILAQHNVTWKELVEEYEQHKTETAQELQTEDLVDKVRAELEAGFVKAIQEKLLEALNIEGLHERLAAMEAAFDNKQQSLAEELSAEKEKVAELQSKIALLERSADQKIAEALTFDRIDWSTRPTQNAAKEVTKEEAAKELGEDLQTDNKEESASAVPSDWDWLKDIAPLS